MHTALFFFAFLFALLLGYHIQDSLIASFKLPEFPVRLGVYIFLLSIFFTAGRVLTDQHWTKHDLALISPVDQLLGLVFGLIAGVLVAAAVAFLCFTNPRFEAAFYPSPQQLSQAQNWHGPDPLFHAPYRIGQIVWLVDRVSLGRTLQPGPAGALLAAGPVGQRFYDTYAHSEREKERSPVQALEAWEQFQSQHADPRNAVWLKRAEKLRSELKSFVTRDAEGFFKHLQATLDAGDLDAMGRGVKDIDLFFPDHPKSQPLKQILPESIDFIRQARGFLQEQPQETAQILRDLLRKYPDSPLRRMLIREILSISPQAKLFEETASPVKTDSEKSEENFVINAEAEARSHMEKFRFSPALTGLKSAHDVLRQEESRRRIAALMAVVGKIQDLHQRAIKEINASAGKERPLPPSLGLGEGSIVSATASSISCKLRGVPGLRNWSQLGPKGARTLYVLFLGEKAEGLDEFDRYFKGK